MGTSVRLSALAILPHRPTPWHFLYFFPDPHGHGSFRPTSGTAPAAARARGPCELVSVGVGPPGGGATRGGVPMNRSSAPLVGADWCAIALGGGGGGARGGSGRSALTWILRKRSVKVDWMSCMRSSNISKASRLYSTSGSFWPHARYWMAFRSWSRS